MGRTRPAITETTFGHHGPTRCIRAALLPSYHKVGEQLNRFQSQGLSQYFLIAAQNFVRRHWANAIIDSGVTGGSGSEVFQGVWDDLAGSSASHTFLQRYRFAGATPARTDIYAIRAKLKAAAAEGDNYGWIMDTGLETDFLGTPEVANFPSWLAEEAVSMGGTGRGMVQKWQPYWQTHVLEDRAVAAPEPGVHQAGGRGVLGRHHCAGVGPGVRDSDVLAAVRGGGPVQRQGLLELHRPQPQEPGGCVPLMAARADFSNPAVAAAQLAVYGVDATLADNTTLRGLFIDAPETDFDEFANVVISRYVFRVYGSLGTLEAEQLLDIEGNRYYCNGITPLKFKWFDVALRDH